jgi:methyl-galactoside transport system substrate-binding protein
MTNRAALPSLARLLAGVLAAGLAVALATGFALALSGCTNQGGDPRIGVALSSMENSTVTAVLRALQAESQGKARLSMLDGQNKQPIQSEQIEALVADKAEVMIINPVDSSVTTSIVFRAKSANIPVVFLSRELSLVSVNMWDKAFLVGSEAAEADAYQAQILADYWKATPVADKNGDGKLEYVLVRGDTKKLLTQASAENRQKAFDEAGVKAEMVAEAVADWSRNEARKQMADAIAKLGNAGFEAVICANDEMALGAIEALKVAGLLQKGAYVPVVGVDGSSFAIDAIADGSLLGTVKGDSASMGRAAFDIAYALAKGNDPTAAGWALVDKKYIRIPYQKVTRENYKSVAR